MIAEWTGSFTSPVFEENKLGELITETMDSNKDFIMNAFDGPLGGKKAKRKNRQLSLEPMQETI